MSRESAGGKREGREEGKSGRKRGRERGWEERGERSGRRVLEGEREGGGCLGYEHTSMRPCMHVHVHVYVC